MDAIASEEDLEAFQKLPESERKLTPQIKRVVEDISSTGRPRYKWSLIQPLINFLIRQVIIDFESEEKIEIGPARPLLVGDSVEGVLDRFKTYVAAFTGPPWTIQRLCELLLEPHKQYSRLHKVVMAIEKLLLVTTQLPEHDPSEPPPVLANGQRPLSPTQTEPPRKRQRLEEEGGLASVAFTIKDDPLKLKPESGS